MIMPLKPWRILIFQRAINTLKEANSKRHVLHGFLKLFEHQAHHRGQTTIYIRALGLKPPNERLLTICMNDYVANAQQKHWQNSGGQSNAEHLIATNQWFYLTFSNPPADFATLLVCWLVWWLHQNFRSLSSASAGRTQQQMPKPRQCSTLCVTLLSSIILVYSY